MMLLGPLRDRANDDDEQRNPPPSSGWTSNDMNGSGFRVVTPPHTHRVVMTPLPKKSKTNVPTIPLPEELRKLDSLAIALSEPNTPASSTAASSTPLHHPKQEDWKEAMAMIRDNPALLTPRVFWTTLEQNPPSHVIEFMLQMSPQVASIPKQGPTALQVAVQHGASIGVIQKLLEACPFALCVTNPNHAMDPLSYAKRHRKDESALIELLSRPLSDWIPTTNPAKANTDERQVNHASGDNDYDYDYGVGETTMNKAATSISSAASSVIPSFFPVFNPGPRKEKSSSQTRGNSNSNNNNNNNSNSTIDRQELNNVKLLCAQVLKGHKKLSKQVKACQETLQGISTLDKHNNNKNKNNNNNEESILQKVQEQQQTQFRRQLIALDMKERAFMARVNKMEATCTQRSKEESNTNQNQWILMNQKLANLQTSWEAWKVESTNQWKEWKVLLDHERQVNATFRNDFSEWMEDRTSTNDASSWDDDYESGKENEEEEEDGKDDGETPIVFATNLGEVSDCAPLRGSTSSSSSDDDDPDEDGGDDDGANEATRRGGRFDVPGMDPAMDQDADELLLEPPPPPYRRRPTFVVRRDGRPKRNHPWKSPLVRKWDRITL